MTGYAIRIDDRRTKVFPTVWLEGSRDFLSAETCKHYDCQRMATRGGYCSDHLHVEVEGQMEETGDRE
jgi:hypothetical protein